MPCGARCSTDLDFFVFFFFLPISKAEQAPSTVPKSERRRASRIQSHQRSLELPLPDDDDSSAVVTGMGGVVVSCAPWVKLVVVSGVGIGVVVVRAGLILSISGRRARATGKKPFVVAGVAGNVELQGVVPVVVSGPGAAVVTLTTATQQVAKSLSLHTSPAQKCAPSFMA